MPRIPTEAQIAASRANGSRSTGPITPEGLMRSAMNALRHGLRAERFLLVAGESQEELDALAAAVHEEFAPRTPFEMRLVERIIGLMWRLRRVPEIERRLLQSRRNWGERSFTAALGFVRELDDDRTVLALSDYERRLSGQLHRLMREFERRRKMDERTRADGRNPLTEKENGSGSAGREGAEEGREAPDPASPAPDQT